MAFDFKTNKADFYTVQSLFASNYTVTFKAPGMASLASSIALQAGQNDVLDVKLHSGNTLDHQLS